MEAAYQSRRANSKQHEQKEEGEGERGRDGGMSQDIPLTLPSPEAKTRKGERGGEKKTDPTYTLVEAIAK